MSAGASFVRDLLADQVRAQRAPLLLAALSAAGVAVAAAALLGVSGWFLTGAALAGLAGPAAAVAFNFLLPSAVIRLLAIVRTALRYGERLSGHQAALDALAEIRPPLFTRMAAARPGRLVHIASPGAALSPAAYSTLPRRCRIRATSQTAIAQAEPIAQPASTSVGQWTPR